MEVVIPENENPIEYDENGSIKCIMQSIYVKDGPFLVRFSVKPSLRGMGIINRDEKTPSYDETQAITYFRANKPNREGVARYDLIRDDTYEQVYLSTRVGFIRRVTCKFRADRI